MVCQQNRFSSIQWSTGGGRNIDAHIVIGVIYVIAAVVDIGISRDTIGGLGRVEGACGVCLKSSIGDTFEKGGSEDLYFEIASSTGVDTAFTRHPQQRV